MKRRQFITFLAWPNAGWPQDLLVQHSDWVHLIVALSGMAYMLSSHSSLSQELGKEIASQNRFSTMPVEPATRSRKATIGKALTCTRLSEGKPDRCRTTTIPAQ